MLLYRTENEVYIIGVILTRGIVYFKRHRIMICKGLNCDKEIEKVGKHWKDLF